MKQNFVLFVSLLSLCWFGILFPAFAVEESKQVSVAKPNFPVSINGTVLNVETDAYPAILYQDVTYLPLTYRMKQYVGIKTAYYDNGYTHNLLFVGLDNRTCTSYEAYDTTTYKDNHKVARVLDCDIVLNTNDEKDAVSNRSRTYPLLMYRDIIYIPLTWDICVRTYGWKYHFDAKTGLSIDTTKQTRPIVKTTQFVSGPSRSFRPTKYFVFENGWVEYPGNTMEHYYDFVFMPLDQEKVQFSLEEALASANYFVNCRKDKDSNQLIEDVTPSVNGSVFTIHCVKSLDRVSENVILQIDLLSGTLLSETIVEE